MILTVFVTGAVFTQHLYIGSAADNGFSALPISLGSGFNLQNEDNFYKPLMLTPFSNGDAERAHDRKWAAFALNLFLGLGIGSFVQGDTDGGVIGICGELGGLTLIIVGSVRMARMPMYGVLPNRRLNQSIGLITAGSLLWTGTRIFEIIRPFTYANRLSVTFNPDIDVNGQPALAAMVKLSLD
jgi:hypothetical protein